MSQPLNIYLRSLQRRCILTSEGRLNSSFPSAAPLRLWASQRGPELQRCMARARYQGHLWADLRSIAFSRHSALAPSEQTLGTSFLFHGHRRDSSVHQTKRFPLDSPGFGFLLSASSDRDTNFQHDGVCAYASILERSVFRDLILFFWCPPSKSCSSFRQVRPRT